VGSARKLNIHNQTILPQHQRWRAGDHRVLLNAGGGGW